MMKNELVQTFDAEVRRHFRWTFTVNAADFALYSLSLSFASMLTILPAFVSKFTSSNLIIGMIPAINVLGWLLPQILAARYVEKLSHKKRFILIVGIGERLPWLFIALAVLLLADAPPVLELIAFFTFYSIFCFSGGINTPAWLDMMGKIIPEGKRGRFFGFSSFIGSGVGVGGALIAGYLLENFSFPGNFAACFMLTFIFIAISLGCIALTREPAYPIVKEPSTLRNYLGQLVAITRNNRNYFFFLIATVIISFSGMATGFFTVHAIGKLSLSGNEIGRFTAITLFFQTVTNPLWGYWGDRKGHKCVMEAGALGAVLSAFTAAFANSAGLFYIIFAITGASLSAAMISRLSIVLEFSQPEERPTYIGLANTVKAPFSAIAPILGGILGDRLQLPFVFLLTAAIVLIGLLVLLLSVKEPRAHRM
jgi:MFS family permease